VVAKVRERLTVNKQCTEFIWKGSISKILNIVEAKEQYRIEISSRFTALKNFNTWVDINRAWETVREYQNFSHGESRLL
jgi:hypothetical protein